MTEYITQEQANEIALKIFNQKKAERKPPTNHEICNAAIQHHIDSQPESASVEAIMGFARAVILSDSTSEYDASMTTLRQAITQQAEALAQALAEAETDRFIADLANDTNARLVKERDQLRKQLATLPFDGELPPLPDFQFANENGALYGRVSMEHYARQAIAKAFAAFKCGETLPPLPGDGLNTINGYDAEDMQAYARQAIANDRAKQVPWGWKPVPVEPTLNMQSIGDAVWVDSARVSDCIGTKTIYNAMLAAAPDPKE